MARHTYRNNGQLAAGFIVVAAVGTLGIVDGAFGAAPWVPAVFAVVCAAQFALALRMRVVTTPEHLVVHNAFRTHRLAWADIDGFRCERNLVVLMRDGRRLPCTAIPRSAVATLVGRRGHDERIADELDRLRRAAATAAG